MPPLPGGSAAAGASVPPPPRAGGGGANAAAGEPAPLPSAGSNGGVATSPAPGPGPTADSDAPLPSAGCTSGTIAPGTRALEIRSGDRTRTYNLHVPARYDGETPLPLLFDFHGASSMAEDQEKISGFRAKSETEGFIHVTPNGVTAAGDVQWTEGPADERFIRDLVAQIERDGCVDRRRIYATGCSSGAGMTNYLACNASDLFAAMAPLCGTAFFDLPGTCKPSDSIAVMLVLGKNDTLNCWDSPSGKADFGVWCAKALQRAYAQADECTGAIRETHGGVCETIDQCKDGAEVVICSVDSGHGVYWAPDLRVTDEAWAFLKRFYRQGLQ